MPEAMKAPSSEQYTDMPVGEILRRTRMHYQQSLDDIERALRIRASQIDAIEQGDLSKLPGRVYAIGFVRTYSEFLGLDGDKMVHLFKTQAVGHKPEPELNFPIPADDSKMPPVWVVLGCIVLIGLILIFWMGARTQDRQLVENIPPVPPPMAAEHQQAELDRAVTETMTTEPLPAEEVQDEVIAEKPADGIILNILENSWVEIRDLKGKAILSRVLQAGDQYYVPDRPDLTISIGNAAGVAIEVDGQKLRALGEKGQVLRRLSLDTEFLKKNYAADPAAATSAQQAH